MKISFIPSMLCLLAVLPYCKKKNDPPAPSAPIIKGVAPGQALAGSDIMITGSGFGSSSTVKIKNQTATVKQANDSVLIVTLPATAETDYIIVSNKNGADTSANKMPVVTNPLSQIRLKQYEDGERNTFYFTYDGSGKLVTRTQKWHNPINGLFFDRSVSTYTYNGAGQVITETYVNLENTPITTRYEFIYTNNTLTGDKVFDVNTTNPANPVSTLTASHDYVILGGQLLHTKTKNASGALVSEDRYTFSYVNDKVQVTRQIVPVSGTATTEIYTQLTHILDPNLALVSAQPGPSYFLPDTATFVAQPNLNYVRQQVVAVNYTPTIIRTVYVNNNNRLVVSGYTYEAKP